MNIYKLPENTLKERIRQHYLSGYELTKADDRIRLRWEAAHACIVDKTTDHEAAKLLAKRFDITTRQAYIDISNATDLFGDLRKTSKDGLRYLINQWSIDLLKKAMDTADYAAAAKVLEKMIKANNLDKEDQDIPDPSKIHPPVQLLSINFNIINSPYFSKIDPKAQQVIRELYERFMKMIEDSPAREYLDLFQQVPALPPSSDD